MRSRCCEDIDIDAKLFIIVSVMIPLCFICVHSRVIPFESLTNIQNVSQVQEILITRNSTLLLLNNVQTLRMDEGERIIHLKESTRNAETKVDGVIHEYEFKRLERIKGGEKVGNKPFKDNTTNKKFQKLKYIPRQKRQVNLDMYYENNPVHEQEEFFCSPNLLSEEMTENPLLCYQCESYSTDKEPRCDNILWKFLRQSEKYAIRVRCPENRGHYCVKSVRWRTTGERKTIRGCHGPGPIKTQVRGKHINLREGCITYYEEDGLTTTCFCTKDLCNVAPFLRQLTFLFVLVLVTRSLMV